MTERKTATEYLALAQKHLEKVQAAWDAPTDWDDLSLYGFYCLEAAISAAAAHLGRTMRRSHPDKAATAAWLSTAHGLPKIQSLLSELDDGRKAAAYGDMEFPDVAPEGLASAVEEYVIAVGKLLAKR